MGTTANIITHFPVIGEREKSVSGLSWRVKLESGLEIGRVPEKNGPLGAGAQGWNSTHVNNARKFYVKFTVADPFELIYCGNHV